MVANFLQELYHKADYLNAKAWVRQRMASELGGRVAVRDVYVVPSARQADGSHDLLRVPQNQASHVLVIVERTSP
jgi:hypothetical protein